MPGKMKVLIADDARSNLQMVSAYIEDAGYEVVHATDGQMAIDEFMMSRPDLVLLDVEMPGVNGIEAAREIRRICDERKDWVPIVFLSSLTHADYIVEGIEAGGDDYLTKPIEPIVLHAKLKAMQRIADMRLQLNKINRQLKMQAEKDGLTGLANRRRFNSILIAEFRRAARGKTPLSLIMLDIDHFKSFNDTYGHQTGDDCLRVVAQAVDGAVQRPADVAARFGGEEFAIILPETKLDNAMMVAEKVRENVSQIAVPASDGKDISVTISCGVACIMPRPGEVIDDRIAELIKEADKGLYQAKADGRNCVRTLGSEEALAS